MRQIRIRRRGARWGAVLLALLLVNVACGDNTPAGSPRSSPTTEPSASGSPETPQETESPSGGTVTYEAWFTYGEHLFVAPRTEPSTARVATAAINAVLAGPTAAEAAAEVGSQVPEGTSLNEVVIEDGIATVDLSNEFDDGGGSASMRMRLAQIVFTATQFPSVQGVEFELDGEPVETFSGEGIVLDEPQRRKDYNDLLPSVLVETPWIEAEVSSPVTVSGTANVFEATVSIRILDAAGKEIVRTFTTATCGTGCRGSYSEDVEFSVASEQQGTVEVYWDSPEDGSAQDVVRIPVTLAP